jgi:lysophospholipase L1-like esterase
MTGDLLRLLVVLGWVASFAPALAEEPPPAAHVVLVGDSTVTDAAGWGGAFARLLRPGVQCANAARGGASTKSFFDGGYWTRALALKPTWVVIQFGHNDMPGKRPTRETDAATTYRANLTRYIEEARAIGARPILVTSVVRRNFKDGKLVDLLADYAAAARAVATQQRVPLIDLHARSLAAVERLGPEGCAEFGPMKDGKRDSTHFSPAGAAWAAGLVAEELRRVSPEMARLLQ